MIETKVEESSLCIRLDHLNDGRNNAAMLFPVALLDRVSVMAFVRFNKDIRRYDGSEEMSEIGQKDGCRKTMMPFLMVFQINEQLCCLTGSFAVLSPENDSNGRISGGKEV